MRYNNQSVESRRKKEEFTLKGHTKYITHVAISQDGMYLVSGSGDKTIKFWDFKQKKKSFLLRVTLLLLILSQ
jgi:FOG: WD40 repeat